MAEVRKPATAAPGARPGTEEPRPEVSVTGDKAMSVEEQNAMRQELEELKGKNKGISRGVRKLAAAILTPAGEADKGQGRRNTIAQALNELVKEFGFEEED